MTDKQSKNIADIPLGLKLALALLREAGEDVTIARYHTSALDTNYVCPLHCLVPADVPADRLDIADALEKTVQDLHDLGATDDDIQGIMGLAGDEDMAEDGEDLPIVLGWHLPGSIQDFEALDPSAVLDDLHGGLTDRQIEQGIEALEEWGLGMERAEIMARAEFTPWQSFALRKAFREGVPAWDVKRIADPRFGEPQMRALSHIAISSPNTLPICLNPSYSSEKMRLIEELETTFSHPSDPDGPRLPYDRLDEGQLSAVGNALLAEIPSDILSEYATGEYPAASMDVITGAVAMGLDTGTMVPRLLNPSFSPEQIRYLAFVMSLSVTDGPGHIDEAVLDYLCDPTMPQPMMEAAFHGFFHDGLDVDTVAHLMDRGFSPEQLKLIYDNVGKLPEVVEHLSPDASLETMEKIIAKAKADPAWNPDGFAAPGAQKPSRAPERTEPGDKGLASLVADSRKAAAELAQTPTPDIPHDREDGR